MKRRLTGLLVLFLIAALALPGITGCTQIPTASAANYKVSLDVNPSIEFTVTDGLVSAVNAYNDDGTAIILATDVVGMTPEDAVKVIVEQMIAEGYIAPSEVKPYLLITVSENPDLDEEVVDGLEEAAEEILEAYDVGCKVRSTMVAGSVEEEAAAAGMSIGRYVLFSYIAEEEGLSLEDAVLTYGHMTMGELMELFEDAKFAFRYRYEDEDDDDEGL
jgi:phosphoribosylaminoimidazole (AIR) synthetase